MFPSTLFPQQQQTAQTQQRSGFPLWAVFFAFFLFIGHLVFTGIGILPRGKADIGSGFTIIEGSIGSQQNGLYIPSFGQAVTVYGSRVGFSLPSSQELFVDGGGTVTFVDARHVSLGEASRVFFQSLFSREPFMLSTDFLRVRPSGSAVAIIREGKNVIITALDGGVVVEFLPEGLNHVFVPSGFQVTIHADKVSSRLAQLLPAKLLKEFPLQAIDEHSVWLVAAKEYVQETRSRLTTSFLLRMNERAVPAAPNSLRELARRGLFLLAQAATFDPARKDIRSADFVGRARENAIVALAHSDTDVGSAWQAAFTELLPDNAPDDVVLREVHALSLLTPSYPAYSLKETFLAKTAKARFPDELSFQLLRAFLDDARRIISLDAPRAFTTLATYREVMEDLLRGASVSALQSMRDSLSQERQALFALLSNDPAFYRVSSFEIVSLLETALEQTVTSQEDLDEFRQSFIQDNLRASRLLQNAVQAKQVTIPDTVALGNYLIRRSQSLRPSGLVRAAVNAFYEEELRRAAIFISFLQEPGTSRLIGSDIFRERFERFQKERATLLSLQQYLQKIGDATEDTTSFTSLREQTLAHFNAIGAVIDSLSEHPDRPGLIVIGEATLSGVPFSGVYDPEKRVFFDIQVKGQTIQTSVSLTQLAFLLENIDSLAAREKAPKRKEREAHGVEDPSQFEDVVRELIRTRMENSGISVSLDAVSVLDFDRNIFAVKRAVLSSDPDSTLFSFSFRASDDSVTSLILHLASGDRRVAGAVFLENLADRVRILLPHQEETREEAKEV